MALGRGVAWARLRVTVVAVAAIAILSVLVYLLTGGTLLSQQITVFLYIPDATGVGSGTPVRVNGVGVGKVDSVALSGSNQPDRVVRIVLQVRREQIATIPADSTAQLSAEGVAGDKYVDITQGAAAARIQPGGEIAYKAAPELVKTTDLVQFSKQLRDFDATLSDIENGRSPVGQFVKGTEMYDDLRRALAEADRGFRAAVSATGNAGRLLRTDEMYRQIHDPLMKIDDGLRHLQQGEGPYGRLLREDSQYTKLREQTANLRTSLAELRAEPFLASDGLYASWTRGLGSVIGRVDQINSSPSLRDTSVYDNLAGSLQDLRTTLHEFRNNPQKFLRIKLF